MRAGVLAMTMLAVAALAPVGVARAKPDLVARSLSGAPASVPAGSELLLEDTVANRGASKAGRSVTRFYLSADAKKGGGDTRLNGKRRVGKLGRDRSSSGESEPRVPLDTPREDLYLLACADDRRDVKERREDNNCITADATIEVELPADCTDRLAALGIAFDEGPAKPGVPDPVTVETPLTGISYSDLNDQPAAELYMNCTLGLALHEMAGVMSANGLVHVQHGGIDSYRCIGVGTPPDCPNGISRHAYADAIDIVELRSVGGETYNVNDDWVIDADADPTCTAATSGAKDALLHALVCDLYEGGVFNILLTPNYNDDHRNHFHLDLTPDNSFIE